MGFCTYSSDFKKNNTIAIDASFIYDYLPEADGLAVKIYIAGLLSCQTQSEVTAEQFATNLNVSITELYDSFVYWEQLELVKILSTDPLVVSYLPLPKLVNKGKKYKPEKYADFTKTLQSMLPDRMITISEYAHYFSVMEDNNIKPDALLLIIKYCVDLKGTDIRYNYIAKVISNFIAKDLTTFDAINNELSSYILQSSDVATIISALKLKRKPEIDDVKLYEKWTKTFGFSLENILFAISKLKKSSMDKLDDFITELYNFKLFNKQEIENYISTKDYLKELTLKINKTLSVYYEVLEPEIETYTSVWTNMGYTEQSLLFLATYCFKSNKRSIPLLDDLIKRLFNQGTISFESIIDYFEEINKQNEFLLKLFDILGLSRTPIEWDRERLLNWQNWGFSEEMITLACKLSVGKTSPFAYVNTLLSNWKSQNFFTPDKVAIASTAQTKHFEEQREYSQEYFDNLITKVSTTKI